ncbi:MAG: alpha/beta fold hydrolase [Planctomycetaceae bacterium]|nr:alpha/beta fold hydrolase [Planctomycetaceae bacterium]
MNWPPFRPHRLLHSGHLQTVAGAWWRLSGRHLHGTVQHVVSLTDGDRLVLHDDCPSHWQTGDRTALLVHGLAGCHASRYMIRIARTLTANGVRTFRLDLRGCGAGRGLARLPYHAGRWPDVEAAARFITANCTGSELSVAGFSLGGNIILRWLGESTDFTQENVRRAIAINPPVDLACSTENIATVARGAYDRHFARLLYRQVRGSSQWNDESPLATSGRRPTRLIEFDELFTAPLSGFENAQHYYASASAGPVIPQIRVPTLILSAADDPLIPHAMLTALKRPASVLLHLERHGGHLGYIARQGIDPDRHWMDWRVVDWLSGE